MIFLSLWDGFRKIKVIIGGVHQLRIAIQPVFIEAKSALKVCFDLLDGSIILINNLVLEATELLQSISWVQNVVICKKFGPDPPWTRVQYKNLEYWRYGSRFRVILG